MNATKAKQLLTQLLNSEEAVLGQQWEDSKTLEEVIAEILGHKTKYIDNSATKTYKAGGLSWELPVVLDFMGLSQTHRLVGGSGKTRVVGGWLYEIIGYRNPARGEFFVDNADDIHIVDAVQTSNPIPKKRLIVKPIERLIKDLVWVKC